MIKVGKKRENRIAIFAFQCCVIANAILGSDANLYVISKIVTLLFFAIMAYVVIRDNLLIPNGNAVGLVLAFALYMFVSLMWSYSLDKAIFQFKTQIQLILLLLCVYLVVLKGATVQDYLNALYVAGIGMIVFALIRYNGFQNFVAMMQEGERMGREIANQNTFGLVFANAALSAAYYVFVKNKKIHIASIFIFTFFALSSGSKKATLLIVAGVLCIAAVHYGIKNLHKTILIAVVVLVAAWYVLQLPIFETAHERLESFFSGELNESDENRKGMIQAGWDYFTKRPIFGYGLSNFSVLDHPYRGTYSHNNYIETLVSLGIVGFVLYYLMLISPVFKILFGRYRSVLRHNKLYLMLLLLIVIELVFGYGMVQLYEKSSYVLLGVALASVDGEYVKLSNANKSAPEGH